MGKMITVFGVIAGLVIIGINTLSLELGFGYQWLGFLVMFIAFSSIFVAIKQYRDQVQGGVIRFATALTIGLGITVVASVVYVAVWEAYCWITDYAYIDSYTRALVESEQAAGLTGAELEAYIAETEKFKAEYANPLIRLPMTFIEIFPIGLLVSVISAAVLSNSNTLAAAK